MTIEPLQLSAALAAGLLLGVFYFAGLWISVRHLPHTRHPVLLLLASFLGRAAVVLGGFFLVTQGRWEALIAALLGFLIARTVLVRRVKSTVPRPTHRPGGARGLRSTQGSD